MRTTQEWWDEVSNSEAKMVDWLKKQYHGEATAEKRIRDMITQFSVTDPRYILWINRVADDEARHTVWVKELLEARGITAEILQKEERYWNEVLPPAEGKSFEYMCAVAHLAETMRLERIKLLSSDTKYIDIAGVFLRILVDEEFHALIFEKMSTLADIEEARKYHTNGMNAIGLVC